jgi:hypothetical protein
MGNESNVVSTVAIPTTSPALLIVNPALEVRRKGWNIARSLDWAADGKTLLISSLVQGELALLDVDLQGNARVLWFAGGGAEETTVGVPSPDGRHLAMLGWSEINGNIWMIENF